MKKKSPPYVIILAVLLGLGAVFALYQHEKDQKAKADAAVAAERAALQKQLADEQARHTSINVQATPTDVRNVFYATQPIEPGARISPAFFEKKLTPKNILPDAYAEGNDIVGMFAIRKIEKGDPLTPRNIGKSLPYMSQRIPPGMRAVALKVFNGGDINNTGGFVVDGDRVDLLFTRYQGDYIIDTKLVMQNLMALYVPGPTIKTDKTDGINPAPSPGDSISVTFEVTPEQAQALIFMSHIKNGHFSMILRARKDSSEIKIKGFAGTDYSSDFSKVQRMVDKSVVRVQELASEIAAKEKSESTQGNTNETTPPTPPSP